MKKKIVLTAAVAGLAVTAACGKNDSYRGGKGQQTIRQLDKDSSVPEVEASVEEKALQILEKDTSYRSLNEKEASSDLKKSLSSVDLQIQNDANSTGLLQMEISVLKNQSAECLPQKNTTASFSREALLKGIKIKGVGRVRCVENDCNNLLLILENTTQDFPGGSLPYEAAVANTAVLLAKDEDGVFKATAAQSEEFAKLKMMDEGISACIQAKSKGEDTSMSVEKQKNRITAIDYKLRDSRLTVDEVAKLKAEREALVKSIESSKKSSNEIITLSDMEKRVTAIDYKLRDSRLTVDEIAQLKAERSALSSQISEIKSLPQTSDEAIQKLNEQKSNVEEPVTVVDPVPAE